MIRASLIARALAPLAIAFSIGGMAGTADAAPDKQTCAGGICFSKDTQGYKNDRTYFYLTFNGTTVTRYNVRYREEGGREVQGELRPTAARTRARKAASRASPATRTRSRFRRVRA